MSTLLHREKIFAIALCFFGGVFGLHLFYLGRIGRGVFYLFTFGLCGILPILDFIKLLFISNADFHQKYNSKSIIKQHLDIQKEILNELKKNNPKS